MESLVVTLGLIGFIGGIIAIVGLISQRDANRRKEKADPNAKLH